MKKFVLGTLSLVIVLFSVLTVIASAETDTFPDDMFDDDVNVTYDSGTTATTKGGALDNIAGDGIGDFVGGVVESVFQDQEVSEKVDDKAEGIFGGISSFFEGFKDIIPTTRQSTTGSNFFDPISPVVTGGFNTGSLNSGAQQTNNTTSPTFSVLNSESVDFNSGMNPYAKPTTALNPGDKGDGVKWLQWVLIYTECGLKNSITGEYDDATATAVKNLQLDNNMTVDGIASLEVIEKAEQRCNDYINGVPQNNLSAPAVFNTVGSSAQNEAPKKPSDNIAVTIIIVTLIILWIFALAVVFIIIHIKRKKITLDDNGEIINPEKREKKNKKVKRTRELQDAKPLKPSETLRSLEDDSTNRFNETVYNPSESTEAEEAVTETTETASAEADTEAKEEPVKTEAFSKEEKAEAVDELVAEPEAESFESYVTVEPEATTELEAKADSEEVTFEVVDIDESFKTFNHFSDDEDDSGEIRASLSLYEMKQRKAKLEEKAKKGITDSTNKM